MPYGVYVWILLACYIFSAYHYKCITFDKLYYVTDFCPPLYMISHFCPFLLSSTSSACHPALCNHSPTGKGHSMHLKLTKFAPEYNCKLCKLFQIYFREIYFPALCKLIKMRNPQINANYIMLNEWHNFCHKTKPVCLDIVLLQVPMVILYYL